MSLLGIGSVAFDTITSAYGTAERVLGGSCTYFSLAASYFTEVRIVAVVGDDFTAREEQVFRRHNIDIRGIQRAPGKTFFWAGEYGANVNEAQTRTTELNVFENFAPLIPREYQDSEFLFLGNIQPTLQADVRRQLSGARLVGGDTMNYWINNTPRELTETLKVFDVLLINDAETKSLAHDTNLPRAAQKVLAMGPKVLVVKHGEYGATVFFGDRAFGIGHHPFRAPTLPIEEVRDPTGAGDAFAGGFMGYIAQQGDLNREVFKRAMFYGGVMGSFAVERFGTERLQDLRKEQIEERFQLFRELTHLE